MKVKNLNKSSLQTKEKIKEGFAKLIQEKKTINNVTITNLCQEIGINRSTFYSHYDNIYGIAEDIQNETLSVLLFEEKYTDINDIFSYFDKVLDFIKQNENLYKMLLNCDEPVTFLSRINVLLTKKVLCYFNTEDLNLKLKISFFIDGVMFEILKYFRGEINMSLDEINNQIKCWFKLLFNIKTD